MRLLIALRHKEEIRALAKQGEDEKAWFRFLFFFSVVYPLATTRRTSASIMLRR